MEEKKIIMLEDRVCYDNDDWYVWADILYDVDNKKIVVDKYGHGDRRHYSSVDYKDCGHDLDNEIVRACLDKVLGGIDDAAIKDKEYVGIPLKDGSVIFNENTLWRNGKMVTKKAANYTIYGADNGMIADGVGDMIIDKLIEQGQSVREVAHLIAYSISYANCDYRHLQHACQQLIRKALPLVPMTDEMREAYDILAAHREEVKKNRPRPAEDKKRAELKEWADKKFPNETDEFKQDKIERAIRNWKVNRQMMYGYRRW